MKERPSVDCAVESVQRVEAFGCFAAEPLLAEIEA